MRITPNGITLNGDAMVMDSLWTSKISSKRPLVVDSSYNITLTARDPQGRLANRLVLGTEQFNSYSSVLSIFLLNIAHSE